MSDRKSSSDYWEGEWEKFDPSAEISLDENNPKNLLNILINRGLQKAFKKNNIKSGSAFFEVGCGGSRWLPYFAKEFGFQVGGIDYTENGVKTARDVCKYHSIDANIIKGDYEQMSSLLDGRNIDVIGSFGFVEHFQNTEQCVQHIIKILNKDGLIITIIPNMAGLYGIIYKYLKPAVYKIHNPIDLKQLTAAHHAVGLEILYSEYLLSTPGVIGEIKDAPGLLVIIKKLLRRFSHLFWKLELLGLVLPRSKLLSPYIICVAKK
jgi:2-polyprenyl-3-methyl-5-hydroxy-6-metoxy-1,4-benzoquinol methylase